MDLSSSFFFFFGFWLLLFDWIFLLTISKMVFFGIASLNDWIFLLFSFGYFFYF